MDSNLRKSAAGLGRPGGPFGLAGALLAQNLRGAGLVEAVKAAMSKPQASKPLP